ncbi:TetR family transcriptional regulator [Umezawaea sp. Da 62-37]|uniref:TetR/AcrR family transcriptional regulator n=1 Tax=Umezawaea sp. Da 62-37 TaxID=3075927 RepID=UPI0028F6F5D8|nr:TetR family transcriptional regulator [Umezawaea sp. Da 62-37]WNV86208.1 TetR family transcriptional regulator [Umezawaea sp. Da 62-37]
MTTSAPEPEAPDRSEPVAELSGRRRRNAADTRRLLLDAARSRFARDGYAGATVRDIADDAGVNVALINRYFTSKEGLFESCLTCAVDDLGRTVDEDMPFAQVPLAIARRLAGPDADGHPSRLMLLLRSSGDEGADRIRVDVLRTFAERLAAAAGGRPGSAGSGSLVLEAQIVLAATFGIVMLRASAALEPLASAGEQDLLGPIQRLVGALLPAD